MSAVIGLIVTYFFTILFLKMVFGTAELSIDAFNKYPKRILFLMVVFMVTAYLQGIAGVSFLLMFLSSLMIGVSIIRLFYEKIRKPTLHFWSWTISLSILTSVLLDKYTNTNMPEIALFPFKVVIRLFLDTWSNLSSEALSVLIFGTLALWAVLAGIYTLMKRYPGRAFNVLLLFVAITSAILIGGDWKLSKKYSYFETYLAEIGVSCSNKAYLYNQTHCPDLNYLKNNLLH